MVVMRTCVFGVLTLILAACGGGSGGGGDYSVRDFARDYPDASARAVDQNRDGAVSEQELERARRSGLL